MKLIPGSIFFLLCACCSVFQAHGQIPEPPVILSVSIDFETMEAPAIITWAPSPSESIPGIVDYYLVCKESEDVPGTVNAISGPLPPPLNSYNINSDEHLFKSIAYTVVAVNDHGGGYESRSGFRLVRTIYLQAYIDSCSSTINLTWNDYENWSGEIYEIKRRLGPGFYETLETVGENTKMPYSIKVTPNQQYEIFIEAHNGSLTSRSNLIDKTIEMSQVPDFINADYATYNPGDRIDLSFTVVGSSELSRYRLSRSESFEGTYIPIDSFNITTSPYLVTDDDVSFTSAVYYYKLEAISNCGNAVVSSNIASNIILSGTLQNRTAELEWNEYRDWEGDVEEYQVIRTIGRENPRTETLDGTILTSYSDDLSSLDPSEGVVCYTVVATERSNPHGIQGRSVSNQACFSFDPGVRIPNAFIPNDTEPVNQVFEPVFEFLPEHYEISIYNRLGAKIWEGNNIPWDGRTSGRYVPEGVYVYYIRVFSHSGEITEHKGSVTVLYR